MTNLNITLIPCHKDNYSYIVQNENTCIVIDACESTPLLNFFKNNKIQPTAILSTHHHWDHVGGNLELQKKFQIPIYGNKYDRDRIPGITHEIDIQNQTFVLIGSLKIEVLFAPGHTTQHLLYYFEESQILFSGDAFFSCGCGRLFEGTYEQLFHSVQLISKLPLDTKIYFGHEYSLRNTEFSLTLEPENLDLQKRKKELLLNSKTPSSPTTLELEKKINPFMRGQTLMKSLKNANGQYFNSEFETFVAIRKQRDNY